MTGHLHNLTSSWTDHRGARRSTKSQIAPITLNDVSVSYARSHAACRVMTRGLKSPPRARVCEESLQITRHYPSCDMAPELAGMTRRLHNRTRDGMRGEFAEAHVMRQASSPTCDAPAEPLRRIAVRVSHPPPPNRERQKYPHPPSGSQSILGPRVLAPFGSFSRALSTRRFSKRAANSPPSQNRWHANRFS